MTATFVRGFRDAATAKSSALQLSAAGYTVILIDDTESVELQVDGVAKPAALPFESGKAWHVVVATKGPVSAP